MYPFLFSVTEQPCVTACGRKSSANRNSVAKATAPGARVPSTELFVQGLGMKYKRKDVEV